MSFCTSRKEQACSKCDTLKTKQLITNKNFNQIPEYDSRSFPRLDFYSLDSNINRMLWYRDIENTDTTKFTTLWNDYHPANYHAWHHDFLKYYKGKKDIELAFQFGPNDDLWAYHTFVVKRIGCCYLVTRSYFRHARFTFKAFSIIDETKLDTFYSLLKKINTSNVPDSESFSYAGYFADNRNKKTFFIDFEREIRGEKDVNGWAPPKFEIQELYDFVDKKINWTKTYGL